MEPEDLILWFLAGLGALIILFFASMLLSAWDNPKFIKYETETKNCIIIKQGITDKTICENKLSTTNKEQ